MHIIAIENAFSKGYHELQILGSPPSAALLLPVTKEYRNRHEPRACFGMGTRNRANPRSLWNHVTDEKRGERLLTVTGLHVNRKSTNWTVLKNVLRCR